MDPYRCYYCNATKTTERDALSHSREHHPKCVVLFLLIVVLFGFLNIKSVKIYAIPFIFSTTLSHCVNAVLDGMIFRVTVY